MASELDFYRDGQVEGFKYDRIGVGLINAVKEQQVQNLKLLCPPEGVYAPVRVYLELSWMKPEDIAKDVDKIVTQPKQLTKIRSSKSVMMVRLEVSQGKDQHPRVKWVDFNGVMDLALITDDRRR